MLSPQSLSETDRRVVARRFVAGRAAHSVISPRAVAAARAAAQASGVAHMGAHALGAGLLTKSALGSNIRKLQAGIGGSTRG